jgi:hypothetical protein
VHDGHVHLGRKVLLSKLVAVSLDHWVDSSWKPLLGYSPEVFHLTHGWFGFKCRKPEDASLIMESRWLVDGGSLMLKRWCVSFDPTKEYFLSVIYGF